MRSLGLSAISVALTAAVIGNAYYQKKQFYPSVVYITKSNPSMAVIYIQSLVLVLMLGKLMRKIFLGTLRTAEFEHLMERFWYALTETCLAFTVFRDDFNPKFVALFTVLLFLKSFHWLAEDRVDFMERSPVIRWLFHMRLSALLTVLGGLDYMMIAHAYQSTVAKGATVQLVFGFEYAILITMVANTAIKYFLHASEMRAELPWENKAVFLLYTELVIGFIRVILYLMFVVIMVRIYTLPMFVFRPMYYTMRNFKKALNDVIMSRRAIRNMNTLYPDATPEELELSDNICIICREDMVNNSKKLPCGHIFHTACLRSWFQRQQTCPTCRLNILRAPITATMPAGAAAQAAAAPAAAAGAQPANVQPQANLNATAAAATVSLNQPPLNLANMMAAASPDNPLANLFASQAAAPFTMQPFPMMSPYMVPPPPVPPGLENLSDEEVRALEGNERRHVEERIKLLRNIQLMLDASVALMNQYSAITARLPPPPPPPAAPTTVPVPVTPKEENPTPILEYDDLMERARIVKEAKSSAAKSSLAVEAEASTSAAATVPIENRVTVEDIGSEEDADGRMLNEATGDSSAPETTESSELRRRRLQKFLNSEQQKVD